MSTPSGVAMRCDGFWILTPISGPPRDPRRVAALLMAPDLPPPPELARPLGVRARPCRPFKEPELFAGQDPILRVEALYGARAAAQAREFQELSWSPTRRADRDRKANLALIRSAMRGETELPDFNPHWPRNYLAEVLHFVPSREMEGLEAMLCACEQADPDRLESDGQPSQAARNLRLAWALLSPGKMDPPAGLTARQLDWLLALGQPWKRLKSCWRQILEHPVGEEAVVRELLQSKLGPGLICQALRQPELWEIPWRARPLRLYLDLLQRFQEPRGWLNTIAERGGPTRVGAALRLLAGPVGPSTLETLARLGFPEPLRLWQEPRLLADNPDLEALVALGLARKQLVELAHHRRLAGLGETLSRGVLEPLEHSRKELREQAYLRGRPEAAERQRRLADPELAARRHRGSLKRAANRLRRSLEQARQASLQALGDQVALRLLSPYLGYRTRHWKLPSGWRSALALLGNRTLEVSTLAVFLHYLTTGKRPHLCGVNRAWLERARRAGLKVGAWLRGFSATIEVGGKTLMISTERDPLEVLKMGTYFQTCLSLEDGSNNQSLLSNALDINKQVLYARGPDGTVVARKLIGATARGELAGYHTYAHASLPDLERELGTRLVAYARECNLEPSDSATPEEVHWADWWDDGNVPWPRDHQEAERREELLFVQGERKLFLHRPLSPWNGPAAFRLLGKPNLGSQPWSQELTEQLERRRTAWFGGRVPLAMLAGLPLERVRKILARQQRVDPDRLAELVATIYRRDRNQGPVLRLFWDGPEGAQAVLRVARELPLPNLAACASHRLLASGPGALVLARQNPRAFGPRIAEKASRHRQDLALVLAARRCGYPVSWARGPVESLEQLSWARELGQAPEPMSEDQRQVWLLTENLEEVLQAIRAGELGPAARLVEELERDGLAAAFRDERLESALLNGPAPEGRGLWARLGPPGLRAGLLLALDGGAELCTTTRFELARQAARQCQFGQTGQAGLSLCYQWARTLPPQAQRELFVEEQVFAVGPGFWLAFEQPDEVPRRVAWSLLSSIRVDPLELLAESGVYWLHPDVFEEVARRALRRATPNQIASCLERTSSPRLAALCHQAQGEPHQTHPGAGPGQVGPGTVAQGLQPEEQAVQGALPGQQGQSQPQAQSGRRGRDTSSPEGAPTHGHRGEAQHPAGSQLEQDAAHIGEHLQRVEPQPEMLHDGAGQASGQEGQGQAAPGRELDGFQPSGAQSQDPFQHPGALEQPEKEGDLGQHGRHRGDVHHGQAPGPESQQGIPGALSAGQSVYLELLAGDQVVEHQQGQHDAGQEVGQQGGQHALHR
ncbi:MAG: hypothetical protein AMXMBFR33_69730 [Candidatus Xenobia bacterium]